jgi:COMPASS component BRE2
MTWLQDGPLLIADSAQNTKAYRYSLCVADPYFRHKQWYRSSEVQPFGPHMSIEDSDKWIHLDDSASIITNEKGWRMSRANVFAREGSLYYEVKVLRGVPAEGPPVPPGQENKPQPHIRMGWARREAPLDAPVGFDGYSYGITDARCQTMHKSRPGKIKPPSAKPKSKSKAKAAPPPKPEKVEDDPEHDDHIRTGDVLGLMITLPSLSLHKKVVEGIYNPAVDAGDGFEDPTSIQTASGGDIIRDRNPVPYRGRLYFEQFEYQTSKPMEAYSDRGPFSKLDSEPNPHHDEAALRTLPGSCVMVFKNGQLIGTAFENLLAFLPPASALQNPAAGARTGFDDGSLGYYPAVAAFCGGAAQVNFGPHFWCPPPELQSDTVMAGAAEQAAAEEKRKAKAIGERHKEQIAEDIVWDIVDEADFFVQDGGYNYAPGKESSDGRKGMPATRNIALKDE